MEVLLLFPQGLHLVRAIQASLLAKVGISDAVASSEESGAQLVVAFWIEVSWEQLLRQLGAGLAYADS
jgi:hypothetical protein